MTRPTVDEWLLGMAEHAAERGTCLRAKVGCVLAQGNRVLALGYVGSPAGKPHCLDAGCLIGPAGGCIRTVHAEHNALLWAGRLHIPVVGATAYCTLSPCRWCAKRLYNAGVARVIYRTEYRLPQSMDWLRARGVKVQHLPKTP